MNQFVETIRVVDGKYHHLNAHIERMQRTAFYFFRTLPVVSEHQLIIPSRYRKGLVKCRMVYAESIRLIEFQLYRPRQINSLEIVRNGTIDYSYKSTNREKIDQLFSLRRQCDEIIIVKNGLVTDSSFSNFVFENEEGLFTPTSFLLKGIQRDYLLSSNRIKERVIREEDMNQYSRVHLINAMLEPGDCVVDTSGIVSI